jgi:hypothetical protein
MMGPSDERWITYVNSMSSSNIFHHPAWINLMAECYGYRPFVIAISDRNGEIKAGLPLMEVNSWLTGHRWVSLPFTDHCMPLSLDKKSTEKLFEFLSELRLKHNVSHVEVRNLIQDDAYGYRDRRYVLHIQELSADTDEVVRNFHRNVRRSIAKAEREGVIIRWAENQHDLDIFYDLHWKTRHRQGVPVQPKRYFELLWQQIINHGLGFILLAYKDSLPIAGGVFLTFKTTLVHKYTASDRDYWRLCPNHALYWSSICWGCEHGYRLVDWGKTSISDTSLRSFKDRWGAQESILTYTILSNTNPNRMTNRLSGIMGVFIRRLPRCVCRIVGELLYKHFG